MSKLSIIPTKTSHDTADKLRAQGWVVNEDTLEVLAPPEARMAEIYHENLRRVGGTPNPPPTLSPEAMNRVRDDLRAGRFRREPHNLHRMEDMAHEQGFPDGAA